MSFLWSGSLTAVNTTTENWCGNRPSRVKVVSIAVLKFGTKSHIILRNRITRFSRSLLLLEPLFVGLSIFFFDPIQHVTQSMTLLSEVFPFTSHLHRCVSSHNWKVSLFPDSSHFPWLLSLVHFCYTLCHGTGHIAGHPFATSVFSLEFPLYQNS